MTPPKAMKFSKITIEDDEKKETPAAARKLSMAKPKKVMLDQLETTSASGSLMPLTLHERMRRHFQKILDAREKLEIHELIDNQMVNVTPKPINVAHETEGYKKLTRKYSGLQVAEGDLTSFKSFTSSIMRSRSSRGVGFRISLDEIINGIGIERMILDDPLSPTHSLHMVSLESSTSSMSTQPAPITGKYRLPFIRIILRKTELQLLYEQRSMTAIKNTEDGNFVEKDNKEYDYLTIGRGKIRRRSEAETQTEVTLYKSREVNTLEVKTKEVSTYVSYYEMFDTYKKLEDLEYGFLEEITKKLHISQSQTPEQQFFMIAQLPSFRLLSSIIKRLLAGNVFEQGQRRFRNMLEVTRMADKVNYKYTLNLLFTINPSKKDNVRRSVSDMSFCYTNSDILSVAYGIYSYQAAKLPDTGEVCIWSIKNPQDPERFYQYSVPVVAIEFSPYIPSLLAIGLFDGSVEVRDIAYENQPAIAISQRTTSPGVDPVLAIKWIKEGSGDNYEEIDPFITVSQDGSVTQYRLINSPFLSGFKLMTLERTQGMPEGLASGASSPDSPHQTNRCAQGLNITKHPIQQDIYYALTDEGCIHKCSTNYQQHYLQVLKTHEASVNAMDFSPWSPKLFLTCGNDWCIRIWMDGIFQPLITLKNLCGPYQWAAWSRVHSTIIVAINRKQVEIWDLRRNILKPMSSTVLCTSQNTLGIFSLDGHSIAIGTERGQVMVNALDDMPFPPYYQYDNLEKAIFKAVSNYPDLVIELKSIGYFGYANKGFVKPP